MLHSQLAGYRLRYVPHPKPNASSTSKPRIKGRVVRAKYCSFRRSHYRQPLRVWATSAGWAGRDITFMQANDHPRERHGTWDSSDISGATKTLVEEDKDAGSWLKKLQIVKSMVVDRADEVDAHTLALAHIYLSWINRGVLPCVEAGGHYRPKHHAEVAKLIFWQLEKNIELYKEDYLLEWVSRGLNMKLPSFAEEFRRAEPLTRIRDIAHRNDIPKDMKHEIKHTLQNKLHRNAGPEDLVAAELMYKKILSQKDQLNDDFVKQYSLFMSELREFFNAGNLSESLKKVRKSMYGVDEAGIQIINRFLELQSALDSHYESPNGSNNSSFDFQANQLMEALHAVTTVRALLLAKLSGGVRNDAPDEALVMRQNYRLSEIRGEDYAFVLLSRFINLLDHQPQTMSHLVLGKDRNWALPLGALTLGLRNLGLTGWNVYECAALENELSNWHKLGSLGKRSNALRMRATLERLQRLCSNFCDSILEAFAENAVCMGKALGVSGHHVSVYAESEIRANIVFQISKLTSLLIKAARQAAGQTAWDTLVTGVSRGRLVEVNTIDSIALPEHISASDKLVLVVKRATGDEDVAHLVSGFHGVGMKVTGIILCQELPHLSHLGVRARQEHLVFTTCTDDDLIREDVLPFLGEYVELQALPQEVGVRTTLAGETIDEESGLETVFKGKIEVPSFEDSEETIIAQKLAKTDTCGAKASNCGVIEEIASKTDSFKAPTGLVIPFGVMERCLNKETLAELDELLVEVNHNLDDSNDISELALKIQELIKSQTLPNWIWKSVRAEFERNQKVIVRSSANVEDLAGLSGAGLHDSVANINSYHEREMEDAILSVWASLHTRRALMARHAAGLPHSQARMAVLIQEQLSPSLSFVLHTTDPLTKDRNLLNAEIAPGLGETLAAGTRGTPWRLTINKSTSEVETTAFANFSSILLPRGSHDKSWTVEGHMMTKVADYSSLALSVEDENRELLGKRLLAVGTVLEKEFGGVAQDVEGALIDNEIYIVQSRPQPM